MYVSKEVVKLGVLVVRVVSMKNLLSRVVVVAVTADTAAHVVVVVAIVGSKAASIFSRLMMLILEFGQGHSLLMLLLL